MQGRDQEAVEGLFERARQAGASAGTADDLRPAAQQAQSSAFQGRARTLAGGAEPAAEVSEPEASAASSNPNAPVVHTITFYQNGIFTVDDGMAPCTILDLPSVTTSLHGSPISDASLKVGQVTDEHHA